MCKQPRSYEYISRNLFGLDPLDLSVVIQKLKKANKINLINDLWVVHGHNTNGKHNLPFSLNNEFLNQHIGFFNLYKKPHPLDFEWRNATETINYLSELISSSTTPDDKILLLGMPTLFANFCVNHIPNSVTLIDSNKPVTIELKKRISAKRFNILEKDIFKIDEKEVGLHSLIFMDPPWYSPHFYQFVWLASRCLQVGGTLGISLPPINTRPNIDRERLDWFKFCLTNGLSLESLYAQKLQYAMPFFEFNAFKAAGLDNILPIWRKGDLAIFRKIRSINKNRPVLAEKISKWIEIEINGVRIRVKKGLSKGAKEMKIESIVEKDILPTVSTRDKRRELANVWTSGNRIYTVNNPDQFIKLLKSKSDNSKDSRNVHDFINEITKLESKEYNNYLEWLYHEMERQID
jgi:hypothetical protein